MDRGSTQMAGTLARRLRCRGSSAFHEVPDVEMKSPNGRRIGPGGVHIQQFADLLAHELEGGTGVLDKKAVRVGRQNQQRHPKGHDAAETDFEHSVDGGFQRPCLLADRAQQHEDRGNWRDAVGWVVRSHDCQRRDRSHERQPQRRDLRMRNSGRNGTAPNGAAERADQPLQRRVDGTAHTPVHHNYCGERCKVTLGQGDQFG